MPIDREAVRAGSPRRKRLKRSARRVGVVTYIAIAFCGGSCLGLLILGLSVLTFPALANAVESVVAVEAILRLEDVEHTA